MVDDKMAADKLRNNTAVEPDTIQSEFLKFRKPILLNELHKVIQKVWTIEKKT